MLLPNLRSTELGGALIRQRMPRHAGRSVHGFQSASPALHRSSIFSKQVGALLTTVVTGDQQQPVQPIAVPRLIGPSDFLLDSNEDAVGMTNFQCSRDSASLSVAGQQTN